MNGLESEVDAPDDARGVLRRALSRHIVVSIVLVAMIAAMYSYYLVPPYWPKHLGAFDFHYYLGPQSYFMDISIHNGEFPLWNPLTFCGTPYAANPLTEVFYPLQLVRSCLTLSPSPWATCLGLELVLVLQLVIAGIGAFALAREYRLSRAACLATATVFVFNFYAVFCSMEQWSLVVVSGWLPLVFLFVHKGLTNPALKRKAYYGCAAGLVFGVSVLGGFPQVTFYMVLAIVLFCILDRLTHVTREDLHAPRLLARSIPVNAVFLGLIFVLGGLVAAAMLLPAAEFAGLSARQSTSGLKENQGAQELTCSHLLKSLVLYTGESADPRGSRAAGIATVLLAVAALTHRRRRDVAAFTILFLILTDCALGPPFPFGRLVAWTDYFQFGSPWRANMTSGLPFAVLVGFGVDTASERLKSRWGTAARTAILLAIGCACLWVLWRWLNGAPFFAVGKIVFYIPAVTLVVICAAAWFRWPSLWRGAISFLIFAEIAAWSHYFVPYNMNKQLAGRNTAGFGEATQLWQDNYRGTIPRPNWNIWFLQPAINGYDPLYIFRARQAMCALRQEKSYTRNLRDWAVMVENQRGNLFLKRSFWLARQYAKGPLPPKDALFPSATTVFLSDVDSLPVPEIARDAVPPTAVSTDTERVPVAGTGALASRPKPRRGQPGSLELSLPPVALQRTHAVLRLAYTSDATVDVLPYFSDPVTRRSEMGVRCRATATRGRENVFEIPLPDFEQVQTTLVWKAAARVLRFTDAYVLIDKADEDKLITIDSRKANSVDLTLRDLPGYRVLTFVDAAYPGWKAYVDSKSVPIHLADDAFKAIIVPPGTSHVRFAFRPWRVTVGIVVSLMSVLTISAILLRRPARPPLHETTDRKDTGSENSPLCGGPLVPEESEPCL